MIPYCEHPDLSLAVFGVPYTSLKVPDHVVPVPLENLRRLLNSLACAYNLDDDALRSAFSAKSKTGKTLRGMRERQPMLGSPQFEELFPRADIEKWGYLVRPDFVTQEWIDRHGGGHWKEAYEASKRPRVDCPLLGVWVSGESPGTHKGSAIEKKKANG